MENFAPGLRESILALTDALRVIVFFVCVAGLIIQVQHARSDMEGLARPLVRAVVIVALVATLPHWFGFTEKIFLTVADTVHEGYTEHPMRMAAKLRDSVSGGETEFSLRRIGESLYQAFLHAAAKLVVLIGSLLQLPFLVLQFILKLLCYLFLPVALALYMIPSQTQLATRYVQQTLAILAWPVGFAVTELVAYHLLTAYADNLATAYELTGPGEIDPASFASLLGGLLGSLWLIVGTIGTPLLMQGLICSGSPVSAGGATAMQQLYAIQQIAYMIKTVKTGGAAAPALAAAAATKSGGGGAGPGMPPPPPPAVSPPMPVTTPPPADPAGDFRAAAALALAHVPTPQTTL